MKLCFLLITFFFSSNIFSAENFTKFYCAQYADAFKTINAEQDKLKDNPIHSKFRKLAALKAKLYYDYLNDCKKDKGSRIITCLDQLPKDSLTGIAYFTTHVGRVLIKLNDSKSLGLGLAKEYCKENTSEDFKSICNSMYPPKPKKDKYIKLKKSCEHQTSKKCYGTYNENAQFYYAPKKEFSATPLLISGALGSGVSYFINQTTFNKSLPYLQSQAMWEKDQIANQRAFQNYQFWWLNEAPILPFNQINYQGGYNWNASVNPVTP